MKRLFLSIALALYIGSGCQTPVVGFVPCVGDRHQLCHDYLLAIRNAVYERWEPARKGPSGSVRLRVLLLADGTVSVIEVKGTPPDLVKSCGDALREIQSLGAPPEELTNKILVLTFSYDRDGV